MNYPILVTAAIIENNGKYLITQRPDDGRHNANRWEFPGGKVNFGEEPRYCLEREILEELDIKIDTGDVFECSSQMYDQTKHVVLLGFYCRYVSGDIKKIDIKSYAWITPNEMGNYDICEADLPFIKKLKKM